MAFTAISRIGLAAESMFMAGCWSSGTGPGKSCRRAVSSSRGSAPAAARTFYLVGVIGGRAPMDADKECRDGGEG